MNGVLHCFGHFLHGEELTCLLVPHFVDLTKAALTYYMQVLVVAFALLLEDGRLHLFIHPVRHRHYLYARDHHLKGVSECQQSYLGGQ